MLKRRKLSIIAVLVLLVIIPACEISFNGGSDNSERITIEQTMQALRQTQTAAAANAEQPAPIADEGKPAEDDKPEIKPTKTPDPTPCNRSKMTGETIPDSTQFDKGDAFTKSWTLRNDGRCEWTTDYKFVFVDGDRMGGAASQNLLSSIEPGESVTLSVDLTAPSTDGEYTGVWRLKDDKGEFFGNYWVTIYVGTPPQPLAVTSVTFYMPHTTIDMACPGDVNIKAEITANGDGKVFYKWEDSEGGSSSTKSVTFTEAGKKIVDYNATISSDGDHWAKLYIDDPNHQWFGPKEFHVNCTP